MKKTTSAFTIVELLIVIVVIGILAAITITAFNGIQNRAEMTKTVTAVRAYQKALSMYKTENGTYPAAGAFCLGDQYGVFTGQATPSCRQSNSVISVTTSAAARDALKPYLGGQLPMPSTKFMMGGTTEYVGGQFYGSSYNYTLDGAPVVTIQYYVKGPTCPVGPVYAAPAPSFTSPSVARSGTLDNNDSFCYLLLPNS
ncbi:MAG: type II secretion system protein [Patescibacteria group bacterium]